MITLLGLHSLAALIWLGILTTTAAAQAPQTSVQANPYTLWKQGPASDPSFFPIAVWLQNPDRAAQYRAAGINTYVALWRGPTEEQLAALTQAGMKVICHQNQLALKHLEHPAIIGWMHGDEPDNAQSLGQGRGYGPPIPTQKIQEDYRKIRERDPSRPVLLNLGQGVAWDGWYGRGVRTNHPEDYTEYVKGCDIASFDIYPVVHDHPDVSGKLWKVAYGVERLVQWAGPDRVVWNCIECTRIQNKKQAAATPHQVRAEVWMSLIHGSRGLIYFVHEWEPKFNEAALLSNPEMLSAVTAINQQIHRLAPVLNQPTLNQVVRVTSSQKEVPVAVMVKRYHNALYLFAVSMRDGETKATFTLTDKTEDSAVEALDENRTLKIQSGSFTDHFKPWAVHLYRLAAPKSTE